MTISYDNIWKKVLQIIGVNRDHLPTRDEDIHMEIECAIDNYIEDSDSNEGITFDSTNEVLDGDFSGDNLSTTTEIIALYIKRNILQKQLEYFQEVYQFDLKEVNSKFYKNQSDARVANIAKVEDRIRQLFTYREDAQY